MNPEEVETPKLTRRQAVAAGAAAALSGSALTASSASAASASAAPTATILGRTVTVHVPKEISYTLEQIQLVQREILAQLGCRACCSGWDIRFPWEAEYVLAAGGKLKPLPPAVVQKALGVGA